MPPSLNQKEVELLIRVFKGNEYLLKLVRNLFYGENLTEKEKDLIKGTFKNEELCELLMKRIHSIYNPNAELGQIMEYWLGAESQLLGQSPDMMYQILSCKSSLLKLFQHARSLLSNPDGTKPVIDFIPIEITPENAYNYALDLCARNLYMKSIDNGLLMVKMTAEQKIDAPLAMKKKQLQNSSK